MEFVIGYYTAAVRNQALQNNSMPISTLGAGGRHVICTQTVHGKIIPRCLEWSRRSVIIPSADELTVDAYPAMQETIPTFFNMY